MLAGLVAVGAALGAAEADPDDARINGNGGEDASEQDGLVRLAERADRKLFERTRSAVDRRPPRPR